MYYKAPGRNFIRIPSILFLIGGIVSFFAILGGPSIGFPVFAFFISLFQIFMSIQGILHCNNLDKASRLKTLGIISLTLAIIMFFINLGVGIGFFMAILGLVIPILYIVGANKNVEEYKQ